jgi:RNA polymerase sigma-70 factor (ECF subfamily)
VNQPLHTLLARLRRLLGPPAEDGPADGQLLQRFVSAQDRAAFETLLGRHGPMVLGVCRRLLRHEQDAEDAFQATFLALARKATAIRRHQSLAGWLYRTAYRAALRLRAGARRACRLVEDVPAREPGPAGTTELRPLLDEEIGRLPERYRLPVVLCYLEGRSTEEAAQVLGCARGTVFSRLAWARERLRNRLLRRGLAPAAAAALTGALTPASEAVPPELAAGVVRAAGAYAMGKGIEAGFVPARVTALTEGVLQTMSRTKLKVATALLLGLGITLGGAWLCPRQPSGTGQARAEPPVARAVGKREAKARGKKEEGVSVRTLPPVVVRTVPAAGETAVSAKDTKEIRVTFSKKMTDGSWSWSQLSAETFPTVAGKVRYEKDGRTCVLPVKLKPGKTYAIWVNSERFDNFKDADGRPAVPYLLAFQTKP